MVLEIVKKTRCTTPNNCCYCDFYTQQRNNSFIKDLFSANDTKHDDLSNGAFPTWVQGPSLQGILVCMIVDVSHADANVITVRCFSIVLDRTMLLL